MRNTRSKSSLQTLKGVFKRNTVHRTKAKTRKLSSKRICTRINSRSKRTFTVIPNSLRKHSKNKRLKGGRPGKSQTQTRARGQLIKTGVKTKFARLKDLDRSFTMRAQNAADRAAEVDGVEALGNVRCLKKENEYVITVAPHLPYTDDESLDVSSQDKIGVSMKEPIDNLFYHDGRFHEVVEELSRVPNPDTHIYLIHQCVATPIIVSDFETAKHDTSELNQAEIDMKSGSMAHTMFNLRGYESAFPYDKDTSSLRGQVEIKPISNTQTYVVNMFSTAMEIEKGEQEQLFQQCLDDLATQVKKQMAALQATQAEGEAEAVVPTIYFPGYIGCGRGGGNWSKYNDMIRTFAKSNSSFDVNVVTDYYPGTPSTTSRDPCSIVLVIDISGSMQDSIFGHVLNSIATVLTSLRALDKIGVVLFSWDHNWVTPKGKSDDDDDDDDAKLYTLPDDDGRNKFIKDFIQDILRTVKKVKWGCTKPYDSLVEASLLLKVDNSTNTHVIFFGDGDLTNTEDKEKIKTLFKNSDVNTPVLTVIALGNECQLARGGLKTLQDIGTVGMFIHVRKPKESLIPQLRSGLSGLFGAIGKKLKVTIYIKPKEGARQASIHDSSSASEQLANFLAIKNADASKVLALKEDTASEVQAHTGMYEKIGTYFYTPKFYKEQMKKLELKDTRSDDDREFIISQGGEIITYETPVVFEGGLTFYLRQEPSDNSQIEIDDIKMEYINTKGEQVIWKRKEHSMSEDIVYDLDTLVRPPTPEENLEESTKEDQQLTWLQKLQGDQNLRSAFILQKTLMDYFELLESITNPNRRYNQLKDNLKERLQKFKNKLTYYVCYFCGPFQYLYDTLINMAMSQLNAFGEEAEEGNLSPEDIEAHRRKCGRMVDRYIETYCRNMRQTAICIQALFYSVCGKLPSNVTDGPSAESIRVTDLLVSDASTRQHSSASLRRIQVKAYQLAQMYAMTLDMRLKFSEDYPYYYSDRFYDWSTGTVTDYEKLITHYYTHSGWARGWYNRQVCAHAKGEPHPEDPFLTELSSASDNSSRTTCIYNDIYTHEREMHTRCNIYELFSNLQVAVLVTEEGCTWSEERRLSIIDMVSKGEEPEHRSMGTATIRKKSNPCIDGRCTIHMYDGDTKKVEDLQKGDIVYGPQGNRVRICCILKTVCSDGFADMITFSSGLRITPWHPIQSHGTTLCSQDLPWEFPCQVPGCAHGRVACNALYSLVVQDDVSGEYECAIKINDTWVISLGHGLSQKNAYHPYLGTRRVIDDLKCTVGWKDGLIIMSDNSFVRNPVTNLLDGIKLSNEITTFSNTDTGIPCQSPIGIGGERWDVGAVSIGMIHS